MKDKELIMKLAALCSRKEICSSDLIQKLQKYEATEEQVEIVMDRLIQERYVDDARYAQFYVRDKYRFNRWGRDKLVYGLRSKRIDSRHITLALEEIDVELYEQNLVDILVTKAKSLKKDEDQFLKKQKLIRFARGRGFEMELIIRKLGNEGDFFSKKSD